MQLCCYINNIILGEFVPLAIIFASMKFFVVILSFYVLALNCFPCKDSGECNVKTDQNISASHQQHHEQESEACTPFCSCACCAAAGFYHQVSNTPITRLVLQAGKFFYLNDHFNSYDLHSVWQPPKIG